MNKAVVKICSDRVQASSVLLAPNGGGERDCKIWDRPLRISYLTVRDEGRAWGAGAEWVHTLPCMESKSASGWVSSSM